MNWVIAAGALCFGIVVGIFVAYYVEEAKVMSARVLAVALGSLGGAGVVAVFALLGATKPTDEHWFYPIGLLAGLGIGTFLNWLYTRKGW
jgi:uncharacterized membrane-anchored protein YhcB (DUF1043 family)